MLADLQARVADLVRDEAGRIASAERDRAVAAAILRYSGDRPRLRVEDVAAGGDTLPLPAAWQSKSELLFAEYPIGELPPASLPCTLYTTPTGQVFRIGDSLPVGALVRLTFTVAHVCSETEDTIPAEDLDAVAAWAASLLLEQLAAAAINDGDATISADATTRRSKAQEYARQAKVLRERYGEALGLSGGDSGQAASGTAVSWGRRERLRPRRLPA